MIRYAVPDGDIEMIKQSPLLHLNGILLLKKELADMRLTSGKNINLIVKVSLSVLPAANEPALYNIPTFIIHILKYNRWHSTEI